jgi:hypothetical protein
MERHFFCTECGSAHQEPADAGLGHLVICLDCAMILEIAQSAEQPDHDAWAA